MAPAKGTTTKRGAARHSVFKVRYATFEVQPDAHVDDGDMWPVSFAVTALTPGVEARIVELVKKAVS
jgi:uncharacterized protein YdhG (YjbR/CyaY superfamily)